QSGRWEGSLPLPVELPVPGGPAVGLLVRLGERRRHAGSPVRRHEDLHLLLDHLLPGIARGIPPEGDRARVHAQEHAPVVVVVDAEGGGAARAGDYVLRRDLERPLATFRPDRLRPEPAGDEGAGEVPAEGDGAALEAGLPSLPRRWSRSRRAWSSKSRSGSGWGSGSRSGSRMPWSEVSGCPRSPRAAGRAASRPPARSHRPSSNASSPLAGRAASLAPCCAARC